MARETPRLKRARYIIGEGDRAQADQLRERYESELKTGEQTGGLTTQHQRDLENSLEELDKFLWGDKPALRAVPEHEHRQEQPRRLSHRVASATAIHARRAGGHADRYAGLGARRVRSSAGRRYAQTGIPGAAESTAQFTMKTVGTIAGLSFFLLLLSPRGSRAIELASSGGVHALRALVSPGVDPLRATAKAQAAARKGIAAKHTPSVLGSVAAGVMNPGPPGTSGPAGALGSSSPLKKKQTPVANAFVG